jgi:hypothetical protein
MVNVFVSSDMISWSTASRVTRYTNHYTYSQQLVISLEANTLTITPPVNS